jgi:hypothetical protein
MPRIPSYFLLLFLGNCYSNKVWQKITVTQEKQPKKTVNTEDSLNNTNNTNPEIVTDMKIEVVNENQSMDVSPITNMNEDFKPMISKSKRKQEKKKQKLQKKKQGNLLSNSTVLKK